MGSVNLTLRLAGLDGVSWCAGNPAATSERDGQIRDAGIASTMAANEQTRAWVSEPRQKEKNETE